MSTKTGATPVGCCKQSGEITKSLTQVHTASDEGKEFRDAFGRRYVYTKFGRIYI